MSDPSVRQAGNRSPPIRAYAGDPRRHSQSLRLTEVAAIFTRTWPAPGVGTGTSSTRANRATVPVVDDRLHARLAARLVTAYATTASASGDDRR